LRSNANYISRLRQTRRTDGQYASGDAQYDAEQYSTLPCPFEKHLEEVEAVQAEHVELLREFLMRGNRIVGIERADAARMEAWKAKFDALKEEAEQH
jgi:hypothetical protein